MAHCTETGSALEKGTSLNEMETQSLRRSYRLQIIYGLESVPFIEQDCNRLDAFQYRGLRHILQIKHPFWSHVKNKHVLELASTRASTTPNKQIIPLPQRLVHRQIKLHGHIIRAEDLDLMKTVSMHQDGTRRKTLHRRTGRPRSKWHTVARKHHQTPDQQERYS